MSNIEQSFQSGDAQAEAECQAEHAVQSVKDAAGSHAGAAADTAQQQVHRAADTVQQTAQEAVAAVKDVVTGGN